MLADLVEVEEGLLQLLDDGGHTTEGGALQLLALEERLGVLDEADIIAGDCFDEMLGGAKLAEGDAELYTILERDSTRRYPSLRVTYVIGIV